MTKTMLTILLLALGLLWAQPNKPAPPVQHTDSSAHRAPVGQVTIDSMLYPADSVSERQIAQQQLKAEKKQLDNLFMRAESSLIHCENQQAKKLLYQVRKQRNYIQSIETQNNPQTALNLIYNTSRMLLRTIDLCQGISRSRHEQVVDELLWLQGMIQWFRGSTLSSRRQQNAVLQSALQSYHKAKQHLEQQAYDRAMREIETAKILFKTKQPAQSIAERTRYELDRIQAEINRLEQEETGIDVRLLDAARQSAEEAAKYLQQGKMRLALESILAANQFLPAGKNRVEPDSAKVSENILILKNELESCSQYPNIDKELFQIAEKMYNQAIKAAKSDQNRLAHEYTQIGIDLTRKARPF